MIPSERGSSRGALRQLKWGGRIAIVNEEVGRGQVEEWSTNRRESERVSTVGVGVGVVEGRKKRYGHGQILLIVHC